MTIVLHERPGFHVIPLRSESPDSSRLDCVGCNIALILRHLGVSDTRTPLGAELHFELDPARRVVLERSDLQERLWSCSGVRTSYAEASLEEIIDGVEHGQPVLVEGDAHAMEWLPFHGRVHMLHSFLALGVSHTRAELIAADAYETRTEWGSATPRVVTVGVGDLPAIWDRSFGTWRVARFTLGAAPPPVPTRRLLAENGRALVTGAAAVSAFADHHAQRIDSRAEVDAFVLACWRAARAAALHHRWLQDRTQEPGSVVRMEDVEIFDARIATPWASVATHSYLLRRRIEAGFQPPPAPFELLRRTLAPGMIEVGRLLQERAG